MDEWLKGYLVASGSPQTWRLCGQLSLTSCARQPEVDILVLCIFLTVDLKPSHKILSDHCMDKKQKDAPIPATDTPSQKVIARMRKCKVVLEDTSIHSVAGKHKMLK